MISTFVAPALVSLAALFLGLGFFHLFHPRPYGSDGRQHIHPWIDKHGHLLRAVMRSVWSRDYY